MMNSLKIYLSPEYLLSVTTGAKFEPFYLYFSAAIIFTALAAKLFFAIKKDRIKAYKKFDSIWFWGFLAEGFVGLFIWFSRIQALNFFSTRLFSYLWLLSIFLFAGYLIYYYIKVIPLEVDKHYEKKRKDKYLR